MDYKQLVIILDWVGSILMLGTIWGWMYGKIAPPIKQRLKKSERRFKAMRRLLRIRHGERFFDDPDIYGKDIIFQRFRNYRVKLGINPDTPLLTGAFLQAERAALIEENRRRNLGSEEEYKELQQYRLARREITLLFGRYMLIGFRYKVRHLAFEIMDTITFSVFSGRIGFILFVFGFVLWNLSKSISLFVP